MQGSGLAFGGDDVRVPQAVEFALAGLSVVGDQSAFAPAEGGSGGGGGEGSSGGGSVLRTKVIGPRLGDLVAQRPDAIPASASCAASGVGGSHRRVRPDGSVRWTGAAPATSPPSRTGASATRRACSGMRGPRSSTHSRSMWCWPRRRHAGATCSPGRCSMPNAGSGPMTRCRGRSTALRSGWCAATRRGIRFSSTAPAWCGRAAAGATTAWAAGPKVSRRTGACPGCGRPSSNNWPSRWLRRVSQRRRRRRWRQGSAACRRLGCCPPMWWT